MTKSLGFLDTIYVIVDGDKCKKNNHVLLPAQLNIELNRQPSLHLPGQFCYTCNQVQVPRQVWAEHAAYHDKVLSEVVLKGLDDAPLFEEESGYANYDSPERAEESKLKKYGYSVSENSRHTTPERQDLLRRIIASKEVSKGYVISYLRHMMQINGKKASNHIALKKWESDLEYVLNL